MIWRVIIPVLQRSYLALVPRVPMTDGGPWLMSSGGGCIVDVRSWLRDGCKTEDDNGGRTGHPPWTSNGKK